MPNLIEERVKLAQRSENPYLICRMRSGWLVIGDVQPLPGYCVFLADPVVESVNTLDAAGRAQYSADVIRAGDALLAVTCAYRINYETLGNFEPALHTHITPRYLSEPDEKRQKPASHSYDWATARKFDPEKDGALMRAMREYLDSP